MTQYKITAPVADFRGEVAGVLFDRGQALLNVDPAADLADGATALSKPQAALAYFKRKGYGIEEIEPGEDPNLDVRTAAPGTPASSAVDPATVAGSGVPAPAPAPGPASSTQPAPQSAATNDTGGDGDQPKLPARTASKADWVDYTTKHGGMTFEDADAMTRDKLAAKYHEEASK